MLKIITYRTLSCGGAFIDYISRLLELKGYRYLEVPSLIDSSVIKKCLDNTNNNAFLLEDLALIPEVTQYIRAMGQNRIGASKVFYIARCFRAELSTNANRLREFTQIGVEFLGDNALDCCRDVRKDLIWLMKKLVGSEGWKMVDGAERGLNLYLESDKAFEVMAEDKQIAGGGPYEEGAGWAIGFERLLNSFQIRLN